MIMTFQLKQTYMAAIVVWMFQVVYYKRSKQSMISTIMIALECLIYYFKYNFDWYTLIVFMTCVIINNTFISHRVAHKKGLMVDHLTYEQIFLCYFGALFFLGIFCLVNLVYCLSHWYTPIEFHRTALNYWACGITCLMIIGFERFFHVSQKLVLRDSELFLVSGLSACFIMFVTFAQDAIKPHLKLYFVILMGLFFVTMIVLIGITMYFIKTEREHTQHLIEHSQHLMIQNAMISLQAENQYLKSLQHDLSYVCEKNEHLKPMLEKIMNSIEEHRVPENADQYMFNSLNKELKQKAAQVPFSLAQAAPVIHLDILQYKAIQDFFDAFLPYIHDFVQLKVDTYEGYYRFVFITASDQKFPEQSCPQYELISQNIDQFLKVILLIKESDEHGEK